MTRNYCNLCKIKDQKGDYDYYKPHHCLNTLIRHETLTIDDLGKEENLGMIPNEDHLNFFLIGLEQSGCITLLDGVTPTTYTITVKGIEEGKRLNQE